MKTAKPDKGTGSTFETIHPVSNCYVEEVRPIWKEFYRVLKRGGVLLAGVDTAINYIVDDDEERIVNSLVHRDAFRKNVMIKRG